MNRKQVNQLKDFQHCLSKQIVENTKANTIIIGDLPVKKMAKKRKAPETQEKRKIKKPSIIPFTTRDSCLDLPNS